MHYCTVTESIVTNRWVDGYKNIHWWQPGGLDFELIEENEFSSNRP